ncbi:MAG: ABC transporter substrate-binding protein [Saccharofermentanales bacterium]
MKIGTKIISFCLTAALLFGLLSCDAQVTPASSQAESEPIELVVDMHGWMPTVNTEPTADSPTVFLSTQKIADEFMDQNPDIKIRWARSKPVGGLDKELAEWFTTQINAGTAPAIAFSWGTRYQDRDWYMPLGDYLDQPNPYVEGNIKWRDIFPSYLWNRGTIQDIKGDVVAIPIILYAGPPTGYYYNKEAFTAAGVTMPLKTWEELITATDKLKSAGFTALAPWGFFKTISFGSWVQQFIIGPSISNYIKTETDYNKDETVDAAENLRGVKEGLYNPVKHDYARELFIQLKRYYTKVLPNGWENSDFMTPWNKGTLGMKEEGIWAIQAENNNKGKKFEFGVFPNPLLDKDTTPFAGKVEYTEKGPYQPDPDLQLNILKPTVKDNPELLAAAVKFLQFLTTPENESLMVLEQGSSIGAVKGCDIPPLLTDYFNNPFPKSLGTNWPGAFTAEKNLDLDKNLELWVKGEMDDAAFYAKVNEIQQAGADAYIESMGIDTAGWTINE